MPCVSSALPFSFVFVERRPPIAICSVGQVLITFLFSCCQSFITYNSHHKCAVSFFLDVLLPAASKFYSRVGRWAEAAVVQRRPLPLGILLSVSSSYTLLFSVCRCAATCRFQILLPRGTLGRGRGGAASLPPTCNSSSYALFFSLCRRSAAGRFEVLLSRGALGRGRGGATSPPPPRYSTQCQFLLHPSLLCL